MYIEYGRQRVYRTKQEFTAVYGIPVFYRGMQRFKGVYKDIQGLQGYAWYRH